MGDRLWTGKPPRRGTRHPGLLSLSLSRLEWVLGVGRGSKQAYRVVHQTVSRGLAVFADAWLSGWLAEISADLRETGAHQRCFTTKRYTNPRTLLYFISPANHSRSGPNSVYVDTSKGDNFQEILGAVGPFWAKCGVGRFSRSPIFCVVNHVTFGHTHTHVRLLKVVRRNSA